MTKEAWAHNEWMRLYIEEPSTFESEWKTISTFLESTKGSNEPSYGERCAAYLETLVARAPESEDERRKAFDGFDGTKRDAA